MILLTFIGETDMGVLKITESEARSHLGETLSRENFNGPHCSLLIWLVEAFDNFHEKRYTLVAGFNGDGVWYELQDEDKFARFGNSSNLGNTNETLRDLCERNAKYMIENVFSSGLRSDTEIPMR